MIREDYILAWIKRYVQWLVEIAGLVRTEDYLGAVRRMDLLLRALLDVGTDSVTSLADGEILARLAIGDPPQLVREKCAVVAAVLKQLGIVAAAQNRPDVSRDCWVKALHLVLGLRLQGQPVPLAEHAPTIDELCERLKPQPLPPRTYGALMLLHEQEGRFDKAEDALFALLDTTPDNRDLLDLGLAFYHRLQVLSDEALAAGGLPRLELEDGLREITARRQRMS